MNADARANKLRLTALHAVVAVQSWRRFFFWRKFSTRRRTGPSAVAAAATGDAWRLEKPHRKRRRLVSIPRGSPATCSPIAGARASTVVHGPTIPRKNLLRLKYRVRFAKIFLFQSIIIYVELARCIRVILSRIHFFGIWIGIYFYFWYLMDTFVWRSPDLGKPTVVIIYLHYLTSVPISLSFLSSRTIIFKYVYICMYSINNTIIHEIP